MGLLSIGIALGFLKRYVTPSLLKGLRCDSSSKFKMLELKPRRKFSIAHGCMCILLNFTTIFSLMIRIGKHWHSWRIPMVEPWKIFVVWSWFRQTWQIFHLLYWKRFGQICTCWYLFRGGTFKVPLTWNRSISSMQTFSIHFGPLYYCQRRQKQHICQFFLNWMSCSK